MRSPKPARAENPLGNTRRSAKAYLYPVSYTHLDVYKRQFKDNLLRINDDLVTLTSPGVGHRGRQ